MKITSKSLFLYIGIFSAISIIALTVILKLTASEQTWQQLFRFNFIYLVFLAISIILRWIFDGLSLTSLVNGNVGLKINLWQAIKMRLKCIFVGIAVPVLLGSTAFQVYLLNREKLSLGQSTAITSIRAILPILLFVVFVPIFMLFGFQNGFEVFFAKFMKIVSLPIALSLFFFTMAVILPELIKRMFSLLMKAIQKIKRFKIKSIDKAVLWFNTEIDRLHTSLTAYHRHGKSSLALSSFWILMMFLMEFSVAILILSGFGIKLPLLKAVGIQFLLKSFLYFAPTPGGSGINEFSYMGFFTLYAPKYLVGISVLMWRMLAFYVSVILGGIITFKENGIDRISKLTGT
ncbi:MAG: lysylphosphatidylglycerol synthase transmembrane domain-containing protein [bacterium]|nr:lysylphosphatidylglycerol synthase transmembrane domain-containing protein [bacterium]